MNLRKRCQTVFQAGYQFGQNSFRTVAQKTNISKSSVHRLYHRIAKRNQHPESSLWETKEGQEWLRLLVLAVMALSRDTCKIVPHLPLTLYSHSFQTSLPSNLFHIPLQVFTRPSNINHRRIQRIVSHNLCQTMQRYSFRHPITKAMT